MRQPHPYQQHCDANCGCEPGDYDECDDRLTAAHELASFLNRPEVNNA